jgi:hypothetical protein
VYEHWRPDKDVCFYVGKGSGRRIKTRAREWNTHHERILKKLARFGLCAEVRLVAGSLSEADAFSLEVKRILFWKALGVKLANQTGGGEGCANPSVAVREKMRVAKIGKKQTPEHVEKVRVQNVGRKQTPEHVEKVRVQNAGRKRTPEVIAAMRERQLSDPSLPGRIEKLRLLNTGRKQAKEHVAKVKAALTGLKRSPEACGNIREAVKYRVVPTESLLKMQTACVGKKASEETRAKMRAAWVPRKISNMVPFADCLGVRDDR